TPRDGGRTPGHGREAASPHRPPRAEDLRPPLRAPDRPDSVRRPARSRSPAPDGQGAAGSRRAPRARHPAEAAARPPAPPGPPAPSGQLAPGAGRDRPDRGREGVPVLPEDSRPDRG